MPYQVVEQSSLTSWTEHRVVRWIQSICHHDQMQLLIFTIFNLNNALLQESIVHMFTLHFTVLVLAAVNTRACMHTHTHILTVKGNMLIQLWPVDHDYTSVRATIISSWKKLFLKKCWNKGRGPLCGEMTLQVSLHCFIFLIYYIVCIYIQNIYLPLFLSDFFLIRLNTHTHTDSYVTFTLTD